MALIVSCQVCQEPGPTAHNKWPSPKQRVASPGKPATCSSKTKPVSKTNSQTPPVHAAHPPLRYSYVRNTCAKLSRARLDSAHDIDQHHRFPTSEVDYHHLPCIATICAIICIRTNPFAEERLPSLPPSLLRHCCPPFEASCNMPYRPDMTGLRSYHPATPAAPASWSGCIAVFPPPPLPHSCIPAFLQGRSPRRTHARSQATNAGNSTRGT